MKGSSQALLIIFLLVVFASRALAAPKLPDLPAGLVWFNTSEPVQISKVSDHFVLLHFGIYSASNADPAVADLKKLAAKYPNELLIVGVHEVKSFDQTSLDAIRLAIQEQSIVYPVAVDHQLAAWKTFRIYALPTVILIAPDGEILFRKPGVDVFYFVDRIITKRMAKYKDRLSLKPAVIQPQQSQVIESNPTEDLNKEIPDLILSDAPISGIDVTETESESAQPISLNFDFDGFIGERIRINREYSRQAKAVKFSFAMPPKTHLLKTVKSYVRVFTKDGELLGGLETPVPNVEIPINRTITADRLFVEAAFYYTREGEWNLYKGLLFEVPLADYSKSETIDINYNVSHP